jgi:hypothetical protein
VAVFFNMEVEAERVFSSVMLTCYNAVTAALCPALLLLLQLIC